jgi:hypothetical protein
VLFDENAGQQYDPLQGCLHCFAPKLT